jgi:hypothetical protein
VPADEPKAAVPGPADIAPGAAPGKVSTSKARPLAGPALPLISEPAEDSGELLGGPSKARPSGPSGPSSPSAPSVVADAVAAKVLVKGEAMAAPAGRADDFSWPRRNVAPVGADPVVATTDLPMTPMVAERTAAPAKPAEDPDAAKAAAAKQLAQQQAAQQQRVRSATYQTQYRPSFFGGGGRGGNFFPFLFGGGR